MVSQRLKLKNKADLKQAEQKWLANIAEYCHKRLIEDSEIHTYVEFTGLGDSNRERLTEYLLLLGYQVYLGDNQTLRIRLV